MTENGPPNELAELRCLVRGRVRGVFFRYFTRNHAQRLGLAGWVRNTPDGTVEVLAEGPRTALEELLADLRQGPWGAVVAVVEARWGPPAEPLSTFEVV